MRAILTNFGSTGSVHPFLALAVEMLRRGHQPVLALSPFFAPWVERLNVEFFPVGPDLRKIQYDINAAMLEMPDTVEQVQTLFAPLIPSLPQMFDELKEACRDADVLIGGPWQPACRMLHELTGIPFVTIQNSHFGGTGTPAFQQATAALINPFRERMGLSPVRDPLTNDANSPQLVLYNMSRHVRPPLPDWPSHFHMPGYFFLDEEWQPDPALVEFLDAGEPPVVITFGSMTHDDPEALTDLVLEAIRIAGVRALIQHGWTGLAQRKLPSNIHAAGFAPHDWLFPRASVIVHHGGAGTAGSVFRSGVPSVFVPHTFDHPLWAELALGIGCAGPPIPYPELNARRLGDALRTTLDNPSYAKIARTLGDKITAERGVERGRELIEQLVYRIGLAEDSGDARSSVPALVQSGREEKNSRRKQYQQKQRSRKERPSPAASLDGDAPENEFPAQRIHEKESA
jgi:sterol 3beta-glucosyltransferase